MADRIPQFAVFCEGVVQAREETIAGVAAVRISKEFLRRFLLIFVASVVF